jgi:hypothetical protein
MPIAITTIHAPDVDVMIARVLEPDGTLSIALYGADGEVSCTVTKKQWEILKAAGDAAFAPKKQED